MSVSAVPLSEGPFKFLAHFLYLVIFFPFVFVILDLSSFSVLQINPFPPCLLAFCSLPVKSGLPLYDEKFLILMYSHILIFPFMISTFCMLFKKIFLVLKWYSFANLPFP